MTIDQIKNIEELFNLRKTIDREIDKIQAAKFVAFGKEGSRYDLIFKEIDKDCPMADLNKDIFEDTAEAAKTCLIKYRDVLTGQLKELGLEE